MAFAGYFIKIKELTDGQGDYTFPVKHIAYNTYKPIRSVQDKDSYRDGDGVLHRNALSHILPKVEFQTRILTNTEYDSIMNNISARYTNAAERKLKADMYIAETGTYTGYIDVYMPDFDITIIEQLNDTTLKYNPIRFAFIGY